MSLGISSATFGPNKVPVPTPPADSLPATTVVTTEFSLQPQLPRRSEKHQLSNHVSPPAMTGSSDEFAEHVSNPSSCCPRTCKRRANLTRRPQWLYSTKPYVRSYASQYLPFLQFCFRRSVCSKVQRDHESSGNAHNRVLGHDDQRGFTRQGISHWEVCSARWSLRRRSNPVA